MDFQQNVIGCHTETEATERWPRTRWNVAKKVFCIQRMIKRKKNFVLVFQKTYFGSMRHFETEATEGINKRVKYVVKLYFSKQRTN